MKNTLFALAFVATSAIVAPMSAFAVDEVNVARGLSAAGAPLAMHGYDPVAYFTDGAPALGSDRITVIHEGAAYRFANARHAELFKANPARYTPRFGGYCAFGASVGKKFDGDPRLWTVHDGKLYLNLNADIQQKFSEDVAGTIQKAEKNWVRIEHKTVASL